MSGRTKRKIYLVFDLLLWACAFAGAAAILLTTPKENPDAWDMVACFGLVICILLRIPVLVHELGHLLFGLLVGMKPISFTVSFFRFSGEGVKFIGGSKTAGATEMIPGSCKGVRARMIVFALGGGVFNLIVGGVLLALYLCLPYHSGLLFCGLFSLFVLYEGIRALVPCELAAGKTDGGVLLGLLKKAPEEEVMLRVLEVQGILYRNDFAHIKRELLFETPVVREDLPAFAALLLLRLQFLLYHKEDAQAVMSRLETLSEYFSDAEREELEFYRSVIRGERPEKSIKKEPLYGVRELKNHLMQS